MTHESLKSAIEEAKRFLDKASKVEVHAWEDIYLKKHKAIKQGGASAALRRASMDLTRALANLRKSQW